MSKFLAEKYKSLDVYTPGEQPTDMKYIKLNTNESPYPPSPEVIAAASDEEVRNLNLYPDPEMKLLKGKIADLYDVKPQNIFLSNGSDDILNFSFMAFASNEKKAYFPDITYGFYPVFCNLHGVSYTEIPLSDDFKINISDYFDRDGLIVIANPNAPTGLCLTVSEIEEILKSNSDNVVLIDEAYIDFGGESCSPLIKKYDNLLVCQTYSKSRSMAGARLGFAIGSPELISDLERIKYSTNPYNINRLTAVLGAAAIDSNDYYMNNCKIIASVRDYTISELKKLGFYVTQSKANFIFAKHETAGGEYIYSELKKSGILVRHFSLSSIAEYNRITVGTKEQMDVLLNTLKEILRRV